MVSVLSSSILDVEVLGLRETLLSLEIEDLRTEPFTPTCFCPHLGLSAACVFLPLEWAIPQDLEELTDRCLLLLFLLPDFLVLEFDLLLSSIHRRHFSSDECEMVLSCTRDAHLCSNAFIPESVSNSPRV
jgi:hypothetical protein